jgi:hypothetical protein
MQNARLPRERKNGFTAYCGWGAKKVTKSRHILWGCIAGIFFLFYHLVLVVYVYIFADTLATYCVRNENDKEDVSYSPLKNFENIRKLTGNCK